jgi:hypothetical protein
VSTGYVIAGQGRNVARASHTDWVNPGNITADDATYATNALSSGESDWLVADTFDLSAIPDDSVITGVRVKIQALSSFSDLSRITGVTIGKDDSTLGTEKNPTALFLTTSAVDYTLGGSADLWGLSLSAAEVKASTFQVRVYIDRGSFENVSIDAMWVEVFYKTSTSTEKVIFLTQTGAGRTWTVPSDWNSTNNSIEVIGAGGGGAQSGSDGASGAGAGAYSKVTNLVLTVGAAISYRVGSGGAGGNPGQDGGDTWFNGSSLAAATVSAEGGNGSTIGSPGAGGLAANGVGDTKFSGGAGGALNGANNNGGGGGGAGGPDGDGAAGDETGIGGAGGDANGGNNGTGGAENIAGTQSVTWMQTSNSALAGPGGGGGGDADGGLYGGGGGGNGGGSVPGGDGQQGIIVITYAANASKTRSYIVG